VSLCRFGCPVSTRKKQASEAGRQSSEQATNLLTASIDLDEYAVHASDGHDCS
jgi:hypothetical protein